MVRCFKNEKHDCHIKMRVSIENWTVCDGVGVCQHSWNRNNEDRWVNIFAYAARRRGQFKQNKSDLVVRPVRIMREQQIYYLWNSLCLMD